MVVPDTFPLFMQEAGNPSKLCGQELITKSLGNAPPPASSIIIIVTPFGHLTPSAVNWIEAPKSPEVVNRGFGNKDTSSIGFHTLSPPLITWLAAQLLV